MPRSASGQRRSPRASGTNPGVPFQLERVKKLKVSEKEVEKETARLARLKLPRGEKGQPALLEILRAIDLTTLSGDDTPARVRRLCRMARSPLSPTLSRALSKDPGFGRVAAVCVYPAFVPLALQVLEGSGIPVATVSAGFPHGLSTLPLRVKEVEAAKRAGAQEIDIVIRREWALSGDWKALFDEVKAFRKAAGRRHLKVILATGELTTPNQVARAAFSSLMAGADFVKTSTGKEKVNATLSAGWAMIRAMKAYEELSGRATGIKPAGGIKTAREAYQWWAMAREVFGEEGTQPHRFRIGASSLLGDVIEALEESLRA